VVVKATANRGVAMPSHIRNKNRSAICSVAIAVIVLTVCSLAPVHAVAQDDASGQLPDQMVYFGLEGDPISDSRPAPVRFVANWMELPDQRKAQIYRLSWWTKIGNAHAAQFSMDYVGIESAEVFRYGGGRSKVRWTSRIGNREGFGFALDLAAHLPLGDETLFPLAARAPMGIVRTRVSVLHRGAVRFWVGWWARRVSPPSDENREDPLSGFASGTGLDALMEWRLGRVDVDWLLHTATGGPMDRALHWSVIADWWFAADVALRVGAGLDTGALPDRSLDYMISLGATWRPGAGESDS